MTCERCSGTGRRVYGSTATWRGGIGGQTLTEDVCDKCWGSGDADKPGLNLRRGMREAASTIRRCIDEACERHGRGKP